MDEDYKRHYKYNDLGSKVLGFTGADNQGIIGLEVTYDKYLAGVDGAILTMATAAGVEIENGAEDRVEPIPGWNLYTSLDLDIMRYTKQVAETIKEQKQAKSVEIIVMNPNNGEIYSMTSVPEFNLNEPYKLPEEVNKRSHKDKMNQMNAMWRNGSETFLEGVMNSCNPVFITIGGRVGVDGMFEMLKQFGALDKTGIDVPGEARTIMH